MSDRRPRLAVHGAGRMGRLVADLAGASGFDLVAIVSRHHPGTVEGGAWFPGLDAMPTSPDVLVDFTLPAGAAAAARWCAGKGVALVSGTTGLEAPEQAVFDDASSSVAVLQSANFSPGINTLMAWLRQASAWLPEIESAGILDVHHVHKKDAPSGTALDLARQLAPLEVTIDSRREGEVVGDHEVTLSLPGERLTLRHEAADRAIFARGALQAAQWLRQRPAGRYGPLDWITDARG